MKRAHSCKHRVRWKWYLGKDGLLYQGSGNTSYLRCYVDVSDDHDESPLVLVVKLMKVMMVMMVMMVMRVMMGMTVIMVVMVMMLLTNLCFCGKGYQGVVEEGRVGKVGLLATSGS